MVAQRPHRRDPRALHPRTTHPALRLLQARRARVPRSHRGDPQDPHARPQQNMTGCEIFQRHGRRARGALRRAAAASLPRWVAGGVGPMFRAGESGGVEARFHSCLPTLLLTLRPTPPRRLTHSPAKSNAHPPGPNAPPQRPKSTERFRRPGRYAAAPTPSLPRPRAADVVTPVVERPRHRIDLEAPTDRGGHRRGLRAARRAARQGLVNGVSIRDPMATVRGCSPRPGCSSAATLAR